MKRTVGRRPRRPLGAFRGELTAILRPGINGGGTLGPRFRMVQIQSRSFAMPIVRGAIATMAAMTTQKSDALLKSPTLKFMPITPASSAPGSRITEVRVSTFMIWFVWWPPLAIRTSKEPTTASRASRASCSVASKRLNSDSNRSPEPLLPSASSSGWVRATKAER